MPQPLQRLHCTLPSPRPRSTSGDSLSLVPLFKEFSTFFVSGGAIGTSSPFPLECQEGVGRACPSPLVPFSLRRLDLVRTAERTDNQFVHSVYCINQLQHPQPALAFASFLQPSPPAPPGRQLAEEPASCPSRVFGHPSPAEGTHSTWLWELGSLAYTQALGLQFHRGSQSCPVGQQVSRSAL